MKVLIAENEQLARIKIRRALTPHRYDLCVAHTLAETRTKLKEFKPDVIVIDEMKGGGVELADQIYEMPDGPLKPYVIITSTQVRSRTRAPHIPKGLPGWEEDLVAKVSELLHKRKHKAVKKR